MPQTYILYSKYLDKFYIGSTKNIELRILKHLEGTTRFTSRAKDWEIVYKKTFETYSQALNFERKIKKMKSRIYIQDLISNSSVE